MRYAEREKKKQEIIREKREAVGFA